MIQWSIDKFANNFEAQVKNKTDVVALIKHENIKGNRVKQLLYYREFRTFKGMKSDKMDNQ